MALLEAQDGANRGMRWSDLFRQLDDQSSVALDRTTFADAIKSLENDGSVKVSGAGDRRIIRRQV